MQFFKASIERGYSDDDDRKKYAFVASTEAEDRMGDVIRLAGWKLDDYKKNPVVLFGHNHDMPIGRAHNVKVADNALRAEIEFAPEEVDPFAAKIGRMVDAGFLRAVSVGFRPLDMKPLKSGGLEFTKSELLEISVVSVPANQEALAFAKSFATESEIRRMFASEDAGRSRRAKARIATILAKHF